MLQIPLTRGRIKSLGWKEHKIGEFTLEQNNKNYWFQMQDKKFNSTLKDITGGKDLVLYYGKIKYLEKFIEICFNHGIVYANY